MRRYLLRLHIFPDNGLYATLPHRIFYRFPRYTGTWPSLVVEEEGLAGLASEEARDCTLTWVNGIRHQLGDTFGPLGDFGRRCGILDGET